MAFSDTSAAEINALRFAALLFPKEITGMEITCAELSGGQGSLGGTSGSARPGRDAGMLLGPIPPRLSAKPDQIFPNSRLLTWKLAAEVSDCAGRCWGGFVKGREGGASTPVPWRKERLDRLDGMVAGGPTGERKEQLSLTHRLHTNVHAGAQTKWRPGRLHAQPQDQAVHCGLRAPPHWRTKAVPQAGHRSRPCTKALASV